MTGVQTCALPICLIRPNVVWFGENLPQKALLAAEKAASECNVFLSIGTTAEVYPAGQLPIIAKENGAYIVEINPNKTIISTYIDEKISELAGKALPEIIKKITRL